MAGQANPGTLAPPRRQSGPTVRPLRLLAKSRLSTLHDKAWAALQAWGQDWGIDAGLLKLDCWRAWEAAGQAQPAWQEQWTGLWFNGSAGNIWPELPRQLASIWWGSGSSPSANPPSSAAGRGTLADQSSTAAAEDLIERLRTLCSVPGVPGAPAPALPDCFAWGSGAVILHIGIGQTTLLALLAEPQALLGPESVGPARPKPAPLHHGIGRQPVTLQVEVGQSMVPLSALLTLAPGDVIRLDRPIDQPARIMAPASVALFAGYLGKIGDQVAVELTPA